MRCHYEVLGVARDAPNEQIKKSFHRLSLRWHPDRNKTEDTTAQFQELIHAWEILGDIQTRDKYDRELRKRERARHEMEVKIRNATREMNAKEKEMTRSSHEKKEADRDDRQVRDSVKNHTRPPLTALKHNRTRVANS